MYGFIRVLNKCVIEAIFILVSLFVAAQFAHASDETEKYFDCVPDKRLQGDLKIIRLSSIKNSEGSCRTYTGEFLADKLELVFKSRKSMFIELIGPITFSARSRIKHNACENFAFRFMDGSVFFDYRYGFGNPYPAQQILVFDQKLKPLKFSPPLEKIFKKSLDVEFRGDCISVVGELRGDFEFGCVRNSTYTTEKKTKYFSTTDPKEYRVLCDIKANPALVLELSEQLGTAGSSTKFVSNSVAKKAESLCHELQQKQKPQAI